MGDLLAARLRWPYHWASIIYACKGMVMPFFMAISHYRWLRTRKEVYKNLTKTWSKGVAISIAAGAVSGTMLSFEQGLLWRV